LVPKLDNLRRAAAAGLRVPRRGGCPPPRPRRRRRLRLLSPVSRSSSARARPRRTLKRPGCLALGSADRGGFRGR